MNEMMPTAKSDMQGFGLNDSIYNRLLKERGPQVYTLLPWRNPFGAVERVHGGMPQPKR